MSEDPDTEMYNEGAGVTLVSVGQRKHRHTIRGRHRPEDDRDAGHCGQGLGADGKQHHYDHCHLEQRVVRDKGQGLTLTRHRDQW